MAKCGTLKKNNEDFYPVTDSSLVFYDKKNLYEALTEFKGLIEQGCTDEQLYAAIQSKVDDGTIASLSIPDNSITVEKLDSNLINELKDSGYIYDSDGNKYNLSIVDGEIIFKKIIEENKSIIQDGLVANIVNINGSVIDTITGNVIGGAVIKEDGSFTIPNNIVLYEAEGDELTVEMSHYYDREKAKGQYMALRVNESAIGLTGDGSIYAINGTFQNGATFTFRMKVMFEDDFIYKLNETNKIILLKDGDFLYYSIGRDSTSKNTLYNNVSGSYTFTSNFGSFTSTNVQSRGVARFKFIRIYNRKLSLEEQQYNYSLFECKNFDKLQNYIFGNMLNGVTNLGSIGYKGIVNDSFQVIKTENSEGEHTGIDDFHNEKKYSMTNYSLPTDISFSKEYESVHISNKVEKLRIGQKYSMNALPYPYDVGDEFFITYESSDNDICDCIQGILIPKKEGEVTIIAKLYGTEISDTCKITIEEYSIEDNTCYIPKNYTYGINPLFGGSPTQTAKAIFGAIKSAKSEGYNRVIFPKSEYHIVPTFEDESIKVCCKLPSDMIVDFNNSILYIDENKYCDSSNYYTMFLFDNIENTKLINFTVHGERYNSNKKASEYHDFNLFIQFKNCIYCGVENSNLDSLTGFQLEFASNNFTDYYCGEGTTQEEKDAGLGWGRGRTRKEDYINGRISDDGAVIENDEWVVTNLLKFGLNKDDYPRIKLGFLGDHYYFIGQRFYDVAWYDENKNLIKIDRNLQQYEDFQNIERAVYFRLSFRTTLSSLPNNAGNDECIIRFYPMKDPKYCFFKNCNITNSGAYSLTFIGGCSCVIENCKLSSGNRYGWAVDFEDGYLNMRHNIICNSYLGGLASLAGNGLTFFGNYITTSRINGNNEQCLMIGNYSRTFQTAYDEKICGVFANNTYKSILENKGLGKRWEFNNDIDTIWDY